MRADAAAFDLGLPEFAEDQKIDVGRQHAALGLRAAVIVGCLPPRPRRGWLDSERFDTEGIPIRSDFQRSTADRASLILVEAAATAKGVSSVVERLRLRAG